MQRKDDLIKIIKNYGTFNQIQMAIEEMAELTKELCKLKRCGQNNIEHIEEEIADVQITLNQLKIMFPSDRDWYNEKIDRTLKRMGDSDDRVHS